MNGGSENISIKIKRKYDKFGMVKVVSTIKQNLLSVGQLTQDPDIKVQFKETVCTVQKWGSVMIKYLRGLENLYRKNAESESGSPVLTTDATRKNQEAEKTIKIVYQVIMCQATLVTRTTIRISPNKNSSETGIIDCSTSQSKEYFIWPDLGISNQGNRS